MNNSAKLFKLAVETLPHAYSPYSHFAVSAAILASDGSCYCGCNVENASYPCGTCAEQGAIAAMIAGGSKQIAEILILGSGNGLISPCGACRQRILEFAAPQTLIHLADANGVKKTYRIDELLPVNFNSESLNHD